MVSADGGEDGCVCVPVGGRLEAGGRVWAGFFWCHLRRSPLIVAGVSHHISQLSAAWVKLCLTVCLVLWFDQKQENNGDRHSWMCVSNSGDENRICSFYSLDPNRGEFIPPFSLELKMDTISSG